MYDKIQETVTFLKNKGLLEPEYGIVLGTGLGSLVHIIDIISEIPKKFITRIGNVTSLTFHPS